MVKPTRTAPSTLAMTQVSGNPVPGIEQAAGATATFGSSAVYKQHKKPKNIQDDRNQIAQP